MTAYSFWRGVSRVYDRLVSAALVLILLVVCYCMYDNYWVYSHTLDDSLLRFKPTAAGYDPEASPISDGMVAWLTIGGTNIDYPVMQAEDNVKYLNTDPFGGYSLSGSIFLDSRCSPDLSDDYSLIYGHHMEYGRMFGALDEFLNESYLREHSSGELIVGRDGRQVHGLEVIASLRASAAVKELFDVKNGGAAGYISANASVLTAEPKGRLIALSTCADGDSVSRVVVICRIIE